MTRAVVGPAQSARLCVYGSGELLRGPNFTYAQIIAVGGRGSVVDRDGGPAKRCRTVLPLYPVGVTGRGKILVYETLIWTNRPMYGVVKIAANAVHP